MSVFACVFDGGFVCVCVCVCVCIVVTGVIVSGVCHSRCVIDFERE